MSRIKYKATYIVPLVLFVSIIVLWLLPSPTLKGVSSFSIPTHTTFPITWPKDRQGAIGIQGYGVLATDGEQQPAPIASIAKIMMAMAILKEKPLSEGSDGPSMTITQKEVDLYASYSKQNDSVLPVQFNEKLTEYQLLQGLLISSGDNVADMLANWVFGSTDNYLTYVNNMNTSLGLTSTHLSDASGLSPQSVSSASDLVILGENFMENPVLAQIVAQKSVPFPRVGTIRNFDTLLGQENVIGIKTGNTLEADGCFLSASIKTINNQSFMIISALMGAKNRNQALINTKTILSSNPIHLFTTVTAGQVVGSYDTPWGDKIDVIAGSNNEIPMIGDTTPILGVAHLDNVSGTKKKGTKVGEITITYGTKETQVPLILADDLRSPSLLWKLEHLFK